MYTWQLLRTTYYHLPSLPHHGHLCLSHRELPEPVLTVDMMPHFEDVAMIPNPGERAEAMRQLIDHLPTANRLLLQYMFKHMGHIIARVTTTIVTIIIIIYRLSLCV
ncbi:MAG: RhoGAP domain-containing protein [Kluyvera sp.]|uniref:RhoGAP domain-containing protein n=1 Tax=Kluyvera sp. TaxID=1538228 RepID=UPI003A85322A